MAKQETGDDLTRAAAEPGDHSELARLIVTAVVPYADTAIGQLALDHPARTAAIIGSVVVISKIVHAARYDPIVALAITTSSSAPSILLGALVASIPAVTPMFFGAGIGALAVARQLKRPIWGATLLLALSAAGMVILLPLRLLASLLALYAVLALVRRPLSRWRFTPTLRSALLPDVDSPLPEDRSWLAFVNAVGILIVAFVLLADPPLWLPEENLTIANRGAVSGYVLDAGPEWVSILTERDRSVLYVRAVDLTGREVCRPPGAQETLIGIVERWTGTAPSMPECLA